MNKDFIAFGLRNITNSEGKLDATMIRRAITIGLILKKGVWNLTQFLKEKDSKIKMSLPIGYSSETSCEQPVELFEGLNSFLDKTGNNQQQK